MSMAALRIVGLLFVLLNYFCKGEDEYCSYLKIVERVLEIQEKLLDGIKIQRKTVPRAQCPDTWISFQGSCYLFSKEQVNFHEAKVNCSSHGAHLVHVQSEEENTFLTSLMRELKSTSFNPQSSNTSDPAVVDVSIQKVGSNYWMGLTDTVTEGVFLWYDTSAPVTFAAWNPGQPSNSGGKEHCVHFFNTFNYAWNDASCENSYKYVCEKESS